MKGEFIVRSITRLVRRVAGIAAQVESYMSTATPLRVDAGSVTTQAEILLRIRTRGRLEQLVLVRGSMRIVTAKTVTGSGAVCVSFDLSGVLIAVALEAKL